MFDEENGFAELNPDLESLIEEFRNELEQTDINYELDRQAKKDRWHQRIQNVGKLALSSLALAGMAIASNSAYAAFFKGFTNIPRP